MGVRWGLSAVAAFAVAAAAIACGAFGSDAPADAPSAPPVDASVDAAPAPPPDAAPTCVSRAPSCQPTGCPRRTLYEPPAPASPWTIATDATTVYWLEQPATSDGYNGQGNARLLRVSKAGGAPAEELATGQRYATALARMAGFVYWTTYEAADVAKLWRLPASCSVPCGSPEALLAFDPGERITALRPASDTLLFAMTDHGALHVVDLSGSLPTRSKILTRSGDFPALTVTSSTAYLASALVEKVIRVATDGGVDDPWAVLPRDGSDAGLGPIANDCASVWGYRRAPSGLQIVRVDMEDAGTTGAVDVGDVDAFSLSADARFLYVGRPNAGGLYAIDKENLAAGPQRVLAGNLFFATVDDDGVYWGEHSSAPKNDAGIPAGGSILMLVK